MPLATVFFGRRQDLERLLLSISERDQHARVKGQPFDCHWAAIFLSSSLSNA